MQNSGSCAVLAHLLCKAHAHNFDDPQVSSTLVSRPWNSHYFEDSYSSNQSAFRWNGTLNLGTETLDQPTAGSWMGKHIAVVP